MLSAKMASNIKELPTTFVPNWSNEELTRKIEYRRLGETDMFVSLISLGAAYVAKDLVFSEDGTQLIGGYENVINSIQTTIKSGINFIDTSPFYGLGKAEIVLGKALEDVPRSAYYLATKVGRKPDCTFDFSAKWAKKSAEQSLKTLGVEYFDILHIHDVEFSLNVDTIVNETLPALDELRKQKKARYIGITGYPLKTLKEIISKSKVKVDFVLSYCRCTPFDQSLNDFVPYFRQKGLGIINAAVLGMGLLTNRPSPYWHPATKQIKDACLGAAKYCSDRGVDIARVSVYYALQQNNIDTHLIGMEDITALNNNLEVLINGVTEHEKQILNEIIENIFSRLTVRHWEDFELENYRQNPEAFARYLRTGK